MEQKIARIYLNNGNNENEINGMLSEQRKCGLRLSEAWVEDRYLLLSFEPCAATSMIPREIVKQGKKKKYPSKKVFRRIFQKRGYSKKLVNVDSMQGKTRIESGITTWEYIAEVETEERYFIFLRCHKFHLIKIF